MWRKTCQQSRRQRRYFAAAGCARAYLREEHLGQPADSNRGRVGTGINKQELKIKVKRFFLMMQPGESTSLSLSEEEREIYSASFLFAALGIAPSTP